MTREKAECGAAFVSAKCLGGKERSIRVNRRNCLHAGLWYVEVQKRTIANMNSRQIQWERVRRITWWIWPQRAVHV